MLNYELNFSSGRGKRFESICLVGFPTWFRSEEKKILFWEPHRKFSFLPSHIEYLRKMGTLWHFSKFLNENSIDCLIKKNKFPIVVSEITIMEFFALVCILRLPQETTKSFDDFYNDLTKLEIFRLSRSKVNNSYHWFTENTETLSDGWQFSEIILPKTPLSEIGDSFPFSYFPKKFFIRENTK